MSREKDYQILLNEYKTRVEFVKKFGISGSMLQLSFIIVASSLKPLSIPYYKFIAPLLLCWGIYLFIKDFMFFLRIEKDMAQMVVDGIAIEKGNTKLGRYFHEILGDFNLLKVLSKRSLVNLVAFACFGFFFFRSVTDLNPDLTTSHTTLALVLAILTSVACKLYYESFKPLVDTKQRLSAAKSLGGKNAK